MADAAVTEPASNLQHQGDPAAAEAAAKKKTPPKRKVAMHMAYLGAGYHGMQRNPGFPTIEAELETALVKAGAISDQNAGSFMKIHWMRAARTDKGVSAVCQVVSAKLIIEPQDTFVERVNALLPKQIRVFGVQRATDGFDARKFCDKRKYEYIMPAWAFDPEVCQGRSSRTAAAAAAAKPAAKPDPTEALKAVAAAVLAAPAPAASNGGEAMKGEAAGGSSSAGGDQPAAAATGGNGEGNDDEDEETAADAEDASAADADASGAESAGGGALSSRSDKVGDITASSSNLGDEKLKRLRSVITASRSRFVFGPEQLERLNQVLAQYQGTHNFHNYTVRVSAADPAARRYILSFTAEMLHIGGQPWVKMVVVGQSFMLHQIRKMVGMAVAVMRGVAPEPTLTLALDPDRDFTTPMAPELGLFLDETYFDAYNKKFGHLHGPVTFEPFRSAAEQFKAEVLYPHIAARDDQELINALWLCGCTNAYYKFTRWASWYPARDTAAALARSKERTAGAAGKASSNDHQQQQQQQGKRRQAPATAAGAAANGGARAAASGGAGEQPAAKQQRLERPGRLQGATAAMVVGMQETYGMSPHRDTVKASQARQELKEMRQEYQRQRQQQEEEQQQQQVLRLLPKADPADLDSLYDMM